MYVPLGALHLLKITCFLFCSLPFGTDSPPLFLTFEMTAVRKHSTCILTHLGVRVSDRWEISVRDDTWAAGGWTFVTLGS